MENGAYLHNVAVSLQHTLGRVFNLGIKEQYEIADACTIQKSPYMWIVIMLMNKYSTFDMTIKDQIKDFIEKYCDCANKTMDEIDFIKVDKMVKEFKNIINVIKGE